MCVSVKEREREREKDEGRARVNALCLLPVTIAGPNTSCRFLLIFSTCATFALGAAAFVKGQGCLR